MVGDSAGAEITKIPGSGGAKVAVATVPDAWGTPIAVDADCIYWADADGVFSLAKTAGGAATP